QPGDEGYGDRHPRQQAAGRRGRAVLAEGRPEPGRRHGHDGPRRPVRGGAGPAARRTHEAGPVRRRGQQVGRPAGGAGGRGGGAGGWGPEPDSGGVRQQGELAVGRRGQGGGQRLPPAAGDSAKTLTPDGGTKSSSSVLCRAALRDPPYLTRGTSPGTQ